ncbi:MAG: type III-B CRISPR module RAMP protein Cmr1 [Gammaproteobacteria bacterium]|nr:type III-B CRISPR module RAMP protein Cmr1 [Gammaproteobacteria bacterium]MBU1655929.1 type III-B CRISPR module RAMP protein Cmr1 [Gammaproteobacteria bacterium]MBU1961801.1 type III-B CRISPR module RAMP protein Cmr1 [Gammaproteobacteria bacterium]
MTQEITATFRIVTPMFLGGADQGVSDGIRPPSIKGALRFWWRALNWGRFRSAASCDEAALVLLHDEEARLFGIAANEDGGGGQGCFLLRVSHESLKHTDKPAIHPKFKDHAAARYLGYGLMVAFTSTNHDTKVTKHAGQLERGCLNEKQEFTVSLVFRHGIDPSVREALIAWGLLGGLGSRSRHGMGSIALISLVERSLNKENGTEIWTTPPDANSYDKQVKALFSSPSLPTTEPPFSAFWRDSRIDRLLSGTDCYSVLNAFGKAMLMYRSWGRSNGTGGGSNVLGLPSEQRFNRDHDWFRNSGWAASNPNFHPERVEFGLPHNYHQTHHHVTSEKYERRSSPLLFHVHPVGNQFIGVGIYLPAQFLPLGEKIKANGKLITASIGWTVIPGFLDGKVGNPPTAQDRFPSKVRVLP